MNSSSKDTLNKQAEQKFAELVAVLRHGAQNDEEEARKQLHDLSLRLRQLEKLVVPQLDDLCKRMNKLETQQDTFTRRLQDMEQRSAMLKAEEGFSLARRMLYATLGLSVFIMWYHTLSWKQSYMWFRKRIRK